MTVALVTATLLSIILLATGLVLGLTANTSAEVLRHTTLSIFATLLTLLSHSLVMFYLIGKGRAVRDAVEEAKLSRDFIGAVSRARKPVFSIATLAIVLTMATAILGGGVDTGAIPAGVHSILAFLAIASNLAAFHTELRALMGVARVVRDVDRALDAQEGSCQFPDSNWPAS